MPYTTSHEISSPKLALTPPELASELNIKVETLARWRLNGAGPKFVRIGRSIRYRRADIDAWTASRSGFSTTEIDHQLAATMA